MAEIFSGEFNNCDFSDAILEDDLIIRELKHFFLLILLRKTLTHFYFFMEFRDIIWMYLGINLKPVNQSHNLPASEQISMFVRY